MRHRPTVELSDLGIGDLLRAYRSGAASPEEALNSCLGRTEAVDGQVNAVLVTAPAARERAAESAARWRSGQPRALEASLSA